MDTRNQAKTPNNISKDPIRVLRTHSPGDNVSLLAFLGANRPGIAMGGGANQKLGAGTSSTGDFV